MGGMDDGVPRMQRTILIAAHDPTLAELIEPPLAGAGFVVIVGHDQRQALDLIRQRHPDLLVLDRLRPVAADLALCRLARARAYVPIIIVTAQATIDEQVTALDLGADDVITRPITPGELIARVRTILRRTARPATPGRSSDELKG